MRTCLMWMRFCCLHKHVFEQLELYNFSALAPCSYVTFMVVRKVMPWSLQRGIILKFDEALRRPGILREQRGRGACVVCAQQFWKRELKQLILFTDPGETELPKQDHVVPTEQERLCDLLSVTRYLERWRHINESDTAKAELIASSVMHPFLPHRVLLPSCCLV